MIVDETIVFSGIFYFKEFSIENQQAPEGKCYLVKLQEFEDGSRRNIKFEVPICQLGKMSKINKKSHLYEILRKEYRWLQHLLKEDSSVSFLTLSASRLHQLSNSDVIIHNCSILVSQSVVIYAPSPESELFLFQAKQDNHL